MKSIFSLKLMKLRKVKDVIHILKTSRRHIMDVSHSIFGILIMIDASVMLAYINWAKIIPSHSNESTLSVKRFVEEGASQFYEVSCIKRVVGYFDTGREKFVIDKIIV